MHRREFVLTLAATAAASHFHLPQEQTTMSAPTERVAGIGGFFFRAQNPKEIAAWYADHLGVTLTPSGPGMEPWHTEAGVASFQPMSETTRYIGDPSHQWMINFRVHSLDKMVKQLEAAGIEVKVDENDYGFGKFAHLQDPEGNKIELWEPAPKA